MFIGRKNELLQLNRLYNSGKFEFAVIYGRRRVGKTAIINEFVKDKNAICFNKELKQMQKQNLENLSECILEFSTGMKTDTAFSKLSVRHLNMFLNCQRTKESSFCLDEYPYVARASRSLASTLQMLIDKYKDSSKLFLILCGSSMSYIEDHVLAYKAPLYGRRTAQFKILPFEFCEACEYFNGMSPEDKALAYGLVGVHRNIFCRLTTKFQ